MTGKRQHTPGPWSAHGCTVYARDGLTVASSHWEELGEEGQRFGDDFQRYCRESQRDYEEACGNAQLQAAAPDLLALVGECRVELARLSDLRLPQYKGKLGEPDQKLLARLNQTLAGLGSEA